MKRGLVLVVVAVSLVVGGKSFAEEKTPPAGVRAGRVPIPSARSMVRRAVKSLKPTVLAAQVKDTSTSAYGFSSAISDEKGSFKLGVLVADLEATMRAGDREKVAKGIASLEDGLARLGAPLPLMMAVINLGAAIKGGVDLEAVNRTGMPIVKPFIEDFITKAGKMPYLRLGEWVESTRLVMLSGEASNVSAAGEFLRGFNLAGYFLEEMKDKGLPQGVMASLQEVAALEKVQETGAQEVHAALKAVTTIYQIMG